VTLKPKLRPANCAEHRQHEPDPASKIHSQHIAGVRDCNVGGSSSIFRRQLRALLLCGCPNNY